MFSVERFSATDRHKRVYRRYEIAYTLCDLTAAVMFVIGSALFFSEETTTAATWLFLIGRVFFTFRPLARTARELHLSLLPVPADEADAQTASATGGPPAGHMR